jgi:DUF1680 family protein
MRLVQQTNFPEEARTTIAVYADKPVVLAVKVRAPHWAEGVVVSVNGRPEKVEKGSDGYLIVDRTWKTGDRIEVSLPMTLRQEPVAGSPELATLAYGPLTLAACMGRDGLSRDMIDANQGPDMERLPSLPMPQFEAGKTGFWVKKDGDEDLSFRTVRQAKEMKLQPLYQVLDERYSVYWQEARKA